jgi:hypothetical protein
MAIDKLLGTEEDPDVIPLSREMSVTPEPSREDMIRDAAQILVAEEGILIDDEIDAVPETIQIPFDSNLVDFLDKSDLGKLASDVWSLLNRTKKAVPSGKRPMLKG